MKDNSYLLSKNNVNIKNKNNFRTKNIKKNKRKKKTEIKIITKSNDNNKNQKQKTIKIREPGIDFVRILAMYAIIIHHIIYFGNLKRKYNNHYKTLDFIEICTFWHVCSYALISGIIGYKTTKYSNLIYLWFCVFFYSVGVFTLLKIYKPAYIGKEQIFYYYFPVFFQKYWYFTQYFGMYLFLPAVNKGISILTKSELKVLVISLISVFIICKDLINNKDDIFGMKSGYSVLGLLIFYITGAYFGKHRFVYNGIKKFIFCFICAIIFLISTLLCYYAANYLPKYINNYNYYNYNYKMKLFIKIKALFVMRISSLPMILQAISVTLICMQIKYNKYIGKVITFLGPLTFGIYLSHTHQKMMYFVRQLFKNDSIRTPLNTIIILMFTRGLKILGICFAIEYFRNILFNICRIRMLCIFLEKMIFKILGC